MAQAPALRPGLKYRVWQGRFEDEIVTIVDNTIIRKEDDPTNQRKIHVRMSDGSDEYMLPRTLESDPYEGVTFPAPLTETEQHVAEFDQAAHDEALTEVMASHAVDPITDPMDPRLAPFRLTKAAARSKLRKYVSREMKNGMTDIDFLLTFTNDKYRAKNEGRPVNIALKGDTQSGKTMLVHVLSIVWAERMGMPESMPVFTLSGSSGITDFDLFGQTTSYTDTDAGRSYLVWLRGVVELAASCGGILYIDEINAVGERVTSSLFSLLDHRHQFTNRNKAIEVNGEYLPEMVTASPDLWIMATYNEGYRGMSEMNEAVLNRFRHIEWGYDEAVEKELVKSPTVRLLGEKLRLARKSGKLRTPVGTAALEGMVLDLNEFGPEMACDIITGLFRANEKEKVEAIIKESAILLSLQEEVKQTELDAAGI